MRKLMEAVQPLFESDDPYYGDWPEGSLEREMDIRLQRVVDDHFAEDDPDNLDKSVEWPLDDLIAKHGIDAIHDAFENMCQKDPGLEWHTGWDERGDSKYTIHDPSII